MPVIYWLCYVSHSFLFLNDSFYYSYTFTASRYEMKTKNVIRLRRYFQDHHLPSPPKGAGIMKKLLTLSTRGNWMEPCGVSPSEEHPCAEIEGIAVIGRPEGQTMADCWPFPQTVFFLQGYEHFRENQWLPSSMLYFLVPSQLCVTTKDLSVECGWGDTCIAGVISCPRHLLEIPISALQPGKAQEDNILGVMGQKYIYSLSLLVISWSSVTCVFRPIFYSTH